MNDMFGSKKIPARERQGGRTVGVVQPIRVFEQAMVISGHRFRLPL